MPLRLNAGDAGFAAAFEALVNGRREADEDVAQAVRAIVSRVRAEGDAALADLTARFDRFDLDAQGWSINADQCAQAYSEIDDALRDALKLAAERIATYHAKQKPESSGWTDSAGVRLGARWNAVEAAGIYVPGGLAAYPSSLLMNAIPAKVAGVDRIVMMSPTPGGALNPAVLAAAHIAGVSEIWRVGGAQAIAALAYGTDRIAPVDVVVGPGNAWVAEAKRQVYGVVGIDMVAGPSEIVVVADGKNDPAWIAADLLSQSEHDETSQSILFTDDAAFAEAVEASVETLLGELATGPRARISWTNNGAIVLVDTLEAAMPLVDRLAPEHLELAVDEPQPLFDKVRHAGSVFMGRLTPEAIGDYVAGPNHVLPTGRRARFSSGLSVLDFMKRTSFLQLDAAALGAIGPAALAMAQAEGLPAHAASVAVRLK